MDSSFASSSHMSDSEPASQMVSPNTAVVDATSVEMMQVQYGIDTNWSLNTGSQQPELTRYVSFPFTSLNCLEFNVFIHKYHSVHILRTKFTTQKHTHVD